MRKLRNRATAASHSTLRKAMRFRGLGISLSLRLLCVAAIAFLPGTVLAQGAATQNYRSPPRRTRPSRSMRRSAALRSAMSPSGLPPQIRRSRDWTDPSHGRLCCLAWSITTSTSTLNRAILSRRRATRRAVGQPARRSLSQATACASMSARVSSRRRLAWEESLTITGSPPRPKRAPRSRKSLAEDWSPL